MNPNATNHSISYFRKFHNDGQLDLTPSFQRKPVWTDQQASYLVDTILNSLPMPEIYTRNQTDDQGEIVLEVVDGQQRLRSIIRFYSGDLVLSGENVSERWRGLSWENLSEDQRSKFWDYKIVVRELERASDVEVRDMFRRLNSNQSNLNDQELRHSQYDGEFMLCVERVADDRWWLDNKIVTPGQIRRMLDAEFISELLVGVMSGPLDKKIGLDEFYRDFDAEFPDRDYWENILIETRRLTKNLAGGDLRGWTSKTEYYSFFIAIGHLHQDDLLPVGRDQETAIIRLRQFREHADQAKRSDNTREFGERIANYVSAVTRASTDLGRRVKRIETIRAVILGEQDTQLSE